MTDIDVMVSLRIEGRTPLEVFPVSMVLDDDELTEDAPVLLQVAADAFDMAMSNARAELTDDELDGAVLVGLQLGNGY